ncbi:hypothetical protein ABBQ38_010011 [Trebouxia sp. C0009 RCD-2024]
MKAKLHFLENNDVASILNPAGPAPHIAGTKVIATIGPACHEVEQLVELLQCGMSCARIDLTWGPVEYHKQSLQNLQEAVKKTRRLCAVLLDTLGRELMIRRSYSLDEKGWPKHDGAFEVKRGAEVIVTTDLNAVASSSCMPITYPNFHNLVNAGDTLFIGRYLVSGADDSSLYLEVSSVDGCNVKCTAQNDAVMDGLLTVTHHSANESDMMSMQADLPVLSEHDVHAIRDISSHFEVDFVSLTFTRDGEDIDGMRDFLDKMGLEQTKILAKLENRAALYNFASIATAADGLILSRGNLGLDVAPEKMALVQKSVVSRCNLLGKPVIITRVLDTMATAPRPTRAEATDVANAVLDGADGLLLGAETLRGKYPAITIKTVLAICRQAEEVFDYSGHFECLTLQQEEDDRAMRMRKRTISDEDLPETPGTASRQLTTIQSGIVAVGQEGLMRGSGSPLSRPTTRTSSDQPDSSLPPLHKQSHHGGIKAGHGQSGVVALQARAGMPKVSSFGSLPRSLSEQSMHPKRSGDGDRGMPMQPFASQINKAESIASTAVRTADKIKAGLIIVYASSGRTASLMAKYRPTMPILTLVVPHLKSSALKWELQGRSLARQCLIMRGVVPMLAAPSSGSTDNMLQDAVTAAAKRGLVRPNDHVVCVMSIKDSLVVKVVTMDGIGARCMRHSHSAQGSEVDLSQMGNGGNPVTAGAVLAPEIELDTSPIPSRVTAAA